MYAGEQYISDFLLPRKGWKSWISTFFTCWRHWDAFKRSFIRVIFCSSYSHCNWTKLSRLLKSPFMPQICHQIQEMFETFKRCDTNDDFNLDTQEVGWTINFSTFESNITIIEQVSWSILLYAVEDRRNLFFHLPTAVKSYSWYTWQNGHNWRD